MPKSNVKKESIMQTEKKDLSNLSKERKKSFIESFHKVTARHNAGAVWNDFIFIVACSISNTVDKSHFEHREEQYLSTIKKYDKSEQELFVKMYADIVMALEYEPEQDFLGSVFMELGLGNKNKAQYFTPYCISKIMSIMSIGDIISSVKEKGYYTINDSCCGGGSTLIATVNLAKQILKKEKLNYQNCILVVGQDIDQTAGLMGYIQLSLLGIAGYVKIADTLTDPIKDNDNGENYWYTPMYYSDIWITRRILENIHTVLKSMPKQNNK